MARAASSGCTSREAVYSQSRAVHFNTCMNGSAARIRRHQYERQLYIAGCNR